MGSGKWKVVVKWDTGSQILSSIILGRHSLRKSYIFSVDWIALSFKIYLEGVMLQDIICPNCFPNVIFRRQAAQTLRGLLFLIHRSPPVTLKQYKMWICTEFQSLPPLPLQRPPIVLTHTKVHSFEAIYMNPMPADSFLHCFCFMALLARSSGLLPLHRNVHLSCALVIICLYIP